MPRPLCSAGGARPRLAASMAEKIAIIGGGPAGLSCAYYLALKGYRPTVFEKNEHPGGMLRTASPALSWRRM